MAEKSDEKLVLAERPLTDQEHKHGFPCVFCGAKTFIEAAEKCRGFEFCPGVNMSHEVFESEVATHQILKGILEHDEHK